MRWRSSGRFCGGEAVHYAGKVLSARGIKLDYAARADLAIYIAGRGAQTLTFCGAAADGWIVSNMCTSAFIMAARDVIARAADAAKRDRTVDIVRYVPCCVHDDRAMAHLAAKQAVAEMLPGFAALSKRVETVRDGLLLGSGLDDDAIDVAARRVAAGEDPGIVLDDRFVAAYTIAGTPADCVAQLKAQRADGITDVALTFAGSSPLEEMRLLAEAIVT